MLVDDLKRLAKGVSKYCVGMEGNISGKDVDGILIKASGSKLSTLSDNDLVRIDVDGNLLDSSSKKSSIETSFHTYLLSFNEVNYVSHTHPVNTLKILCSHDSAIFSKRRLFPDQVIFNGINSCLIPYAKPGLELTNKIIEFVEKFIIDNGYFPKLILLENHGIITCGSTIDECIIATEICEKSAEIFTSALSFDRLNFLTNKETHDLVNDENEKYRENLIK